MDGMPGWMTEQYYDQHHAYSQSMQFQEMHPHQQHVGEESGFKNPLPDLLDSLERMLAASTQGSRVAARHGLTDSYGYRGIQRQERTAEGDALIQKLSQISEKGQADVEEKLNTPTTRRASILREKHLAVPGGSGDNPDEVGELEVEKKKSILLVDILRWYIYHCDLIPLKALYSTPMLKGAFTWLGCPDGVDKGELLGPMLNHMYETFVSQRRTEIHTSQTYQVVITVKSFKDNSKHPSYVMMVAFRSFEGKAVVGTVYKEVKGPAALTNQLQVIEAQIAALPVPIGIIVDADQGIQVCQGLHTAQPGLVTLVCQARAIRDLLKHIIDTDLMLQETILRARILYAYASEHGLLSIEQQELVKKRKRAISRLGRPGMVEFSMELIEVDKINVLVKNHVTSFAIQDDVQAEIESLREIASSSSLWEQILMYSKLLEPIVKILCTVEHEGSTLGQMHLIWHYLVNHAQIWVDMISRSQQTESDAILRCTSLQTIVQKVKDSRVSAYHPVFTIAYLLDARLWKIRNGIGKPKTHTVTSEDLDLARGYASSLQSAGAQADIDKLLEYGVPIGRGDPLHLLLRDVLYGWKIPSDTNMKSVSKLLASWTGTLSIMLPNLLHLTIKLLGLRATACRSQGALSMMKWFATNTEDIDEESQMKMTILAVDRKFKIADKPFCKEAFSQTPKSMFLDYFGLDENDKVPTGFPSTSPPNLQLSSVKEENRKDNQGEVTPRHHNTRAVQRKLVDDFKPVDTEPSKRKGIESPTAVMRVKSRKGDPVATRVE